MTTEPSVGIGRVQPFEGLGAPMRLSRATDRFWVPTAASVGVGRARHAHAQSRGMTGGRKPLSPAARIRKYISSLSS